MDVKNFQLTQAFPNHNPDTDFEMELTKPFQASTEKTFDAGAIATGFFTAIVLGTAGYYL